MKKKTTEIISLLILIAIIITSLVLNFPEFLMGNYASIKNVIVTGLYIATWILVYIVGKGIKSKIILNFSLVFWVLNLILGIVVYANEKDIPVGWAIPLTALFGGQWYGIRYFYPNGFMAFSILVMTISLFMCIASYISFRKQ